MDENLGSHAFKFEKNQFITLVIMGKMSWQYEYTFLYIKENLERLQNYLSCSNIVLCDIKLVTFVFCCLMYVEVFLSGYKLYRLQCEF